MAEAKLYDKWEMELEFTEEEVRGYRPQAFAEGRVRSLCLLARQAHRAGMLGLGKEEFWKWSARMFEDVASWYCHALVIPGINRDGITSIDWDTAEGKSATIAAHEMADTSELLDKWLIQYAESRIKDMYYVVTIGRKARRDPAAEWKKADRSASNKLANCVHKEIYLSDHLKDRVSSLSVWTSPSKGA